MEKKHIIINAVAVIVVLLVVGYEGYTRVKDFIVNTAKNNYISGVNETVDKVYKYAEMTGCTEDKYFQVQSPTDKTKIIYLKKSDCK